MPSRTAGAALDDYYRRVADRLIEQIERGTAPWTKAWQAGEKIMPRNVKTGLPYRGGNSMWLKSTAERRGYTDERWGTFNQIRELGGRVLRGEKGCAILFWQFESQRVRRGADGAVVQDDQGKPVYDKQRLDSPRVYRYTVFNAEQATGLPSAPSRPGMHRWSRREEAERVLRASGARIQHTEEDRALYDYERDRIILPHRVRFPDAAGYYRTALHEMGHWTGHPDRLNRATLRRGVVQGQGSEAYAREEMRAEIASMMTGDRLGLGHQPHRHAAYVKHWIDQLKKSPQEMYRASRDAQEISDYLLGRGRERGPERGEKEMGLRLQAGREARADSLHSRRELPAVRPLPLAAPSRGWERGRPAGPER